MTKVTKDMIIVDILKDRPELAEILMDAGMGCIYCPASQMESLEQACAVHGIDADALLDYIYQEVDPVYEKQYAEREQALKDAADAANEAEKAAKESAAV
ncbi:MAG: DUF1858 domain-containing protein [Lachnospiraceae bacterium]|jgi:hybrid cluster-associated redox disulfide protein|nr:DUF1858 domain-containing protein [Lachnospiraceae bacterium]MEE3460987.1 DUF1858 domain-containing protein [Lachnospiraceae bacterium]